MLTMVGLGLLVILATAATTTIAQQLPSGHFHIVDFQGRCVDYVPTSTNNFVPIVTNTCVNGTQSQIWNVVPDFPGVPTGIIINTAGPFSTITFASSTTVEPFNGLHQQLQLNTQPPPEEDFFFEQVDATHWQLGDTAGGGLWTSWKARSNPQFASPLTLEDGPSGSSDPQQLFTFVGPL